PDKGGAVVVKKGRYGPYVSHDGVNATLPADMTPETVTLEQAIPLLDARAALGTGKNKKAPKKPPKLPKTAAPATQPADTTGKGKASGKAKNAKAKPGAAKP